MCDCNVTTVNFQAVLFVEIHGVTTHSLELSWVCLSVFGRPLRDKRSVDIVHLTSRQCTTAKECISLVVCIHVDYLTTSHQSPNQSKKLVWLLVQ
jgi:hypothetical protein